MSLRRSSDPIRSGRAHALGVPVFVLLVGLFVAAVGATRSPAAPAGAAVPRFAFAKCPGTKFPIKELKKARCGFLVVPANRARPHGRTIRLAVAIVPAKSPRPAADPVVHMSGGPGVPAILEIPNLVQAGLNRDRELIVMDQRGQLYSKPALTCPEIDGFNARAVSLPFYAAATGRLHVSATTRCHHRLAAEGIELGAYNTTENAADFAALRTALGITQWDVYGSSYGTDLALTYMRDFPQGIRSVILDGVAPPSAVSLGWAWTSVKQGFDNLFAACHAQPRCATQYPHLGQTFARLVQKLTRHPVTTEVIPPGLHHRIKVVLDGGALVNWLVAAPGFAPAGIPRAIEALAHGHPAPIAQAWGSAASPQVADFPLGYGLKFGAFCGEWVPYSGRGDLLRQGRRAFPTYPKSVLRQAPQLPFLTEDCKVWSVPKAPASQRVITRSPIPTLVLSGGFDSKTAPRWGQYAARTLPNSTVVTIPGVGHIVAPKSACAQRVLGSFLATPLTPATKCVARLRPPPFTIEPTRLPRRFVVSLKVVRPFFPQVTQQASARLNSTASGNPTRTLSVIYVNPGDSRRVTLSVDQYSSSRAASAAYGRAAQRSRRVFGFHPLTAPIVGERAFAGTVTIGGETHVGLGVLSGRLVVGATLAGYGATKRNVATLVALARVQRSVAAAVLGAGASLQRAADFNARLSR